MSFRNTIVWYILDEKNNPIGVKDIIRWGHWWEEARKEKRTIVAQDTLPDGTFISTVFLGIDHGFMEEVPILFETMAFNKRKKDSKWALGEDIYQMRYATWDEAKKGHMQAIIRVLGEKATTYLEKYDVKYN